MVTSSKLLLSLASWFATKERKLNVRLLLTTTTRSGLGANAQ